MLLARVREMDEAIQAVFNVVYTTTNKLLTIDQWAPIRFFN